MPQGFYERGLKPDREVEGIYKSVLQNVFVYKTYKIAYKDIRITRPVLMYGNLQKKIQSHEMGLMVRGQSIYMSSERPTCFGIFKLLNSFFKG